MAFGMGRAMVMPLLVINFALYLISACLAGWALNRNFDGAAGEGTVGNGTITLVFLILALVACMVGLASCLAGLHHVRVYRHDSLSSAAAASLIAWLLTLLAMGLAAKEIHTGGGYRPRRLKTLEAFIIILSLFELLYLLSVHAGGFLKGANAPAYAVITSGRHGHHHHGHHSSSGNLGAQPHEGHVDYGHHTDKKIPRGHVAPPVTTV